MNKSKPSANASKHQFKAKPVDSKLFQNGGATGVRKPVSQPTTEPVSPNITKPKSSLKRGYEEMEKEEKKEFKAMPIPCDMFTKITGVPEKRTLPTTVPCSPKLSKRRKVIADETEEQKEIKKCATEDKTIQSNKLKSVKPFTETSNIILHTAIRSQERLKFDNEVMKMNEERLAAVEKRKQLQKIEDEEKIKLLRQSLVHKAGPIQNYPPINIKKSTKPLTEPVSPVHHYKTRSSSKVEQL